MTARPAPPALHERALLVALPVLAWAFFPGFGNAFSPKQHLAGVLMWAVAAALCLRATRPRLGLVAPALVLAAAAALAAGRADNRGGALQAWLYLAAGPALFAALASCGTTRAFRRGWPVALTLAGAGVAGLGLVQALAPVDASFGLQALGKMRVFSTLGNPNHVAFLLLASIPAALQLWGRTRWAGAAAALMLCALVATQSRSGQLAAAVGVLAWLGARQRRWASAAAFAVLLGGVAAGTLTHSGRGRLLVWREALDIWAGAPLFGVGPGQLNVHQAAAQAAVLAQPKWSAWAQNASFVTDAHQQVLNLLVEAGPLAAAAFVALCAALLVHGARRAPAQRLAWAGFAAQVAFAMLNTPLNFSPLDLVFWVGAALLIAPLTPPGPMALRRAPLALAPLAAAAVAAGLAPRLLESNRLDGEAHALLEHGPFGRAVSALSRAAHHAPYDRCLRERLALALYFDGQPERAVEQLREARRACGDVGIDYLEAELLARAGRSAEAAAVLERVHRAFPQHVTPLFMLGQLYLQLGRPGEAAAALQAVVAMPDSPHNLKLDRQKVLRQRELARELLERAPPLAAWREGP